MHTFPIGVVSSSVQSSRVPESPPVSSVISSVQLPFAGCPFSVARDPSGLYVPVNGAVPAVIEVVAASSNQVFV